MSASAARSRPEETHSTEIRLEHDAGLEVTDPPDFLRALCYNRRMLVANASA